MMETTMNTIDYTLIILMCLVAQFTPENGKNIMLSSPSQKEKLNVVYIKNEKMWSIKENGKAMNFKYDKKTEKISVNDGDKNQEMPIKELFKMDKKINWQKVNSVELNPKINEKQQTTINIKREKKSVTFSQDNGFLNDFKGITVSWE